MKTKTRTLASASLLVVVASTGVLAQRGTPPAAGQNAALRYWMAFAVMQDPPTDSATTELLANVEAGRAPWNEARLGPIVDRNQQALETMNRASRLATCDWGVERELGPFAPIAHLARARVLARLNTLAGVRLAAGGRLDEAIDRWIAGVRFSQHIAENGSLIAMLTARVALRSAFEALLRTAEPGSLSDARRQRIQAAAAAVPETGFAWDVALLNEQAGLDVFVTQLRSPEEFARAWERAAGSPPPAGLSVPSGAAITSFRQFMMEAADAFRLTPDRTRSSLRDLEVARKKLHPFYQGVIPSLTRVNETRAEVKAERDQLLAALSRPGK